MIVFHLEAGSVIIRLLKREDGLLLLSYVIINSMSVGQTGGSSSFLLFNHFIA